MTTPVWYSKANLDLQFSSINSQFSGVNTQVSTNTTAIATNTTAIATNTTAISTNGAAITNLQGGVTVAPAPSGGDDSAVLQALLNTAQSTGGTVILRAGTYKANLATAQSFSQPRILGQGRDQTIIQGNVNTSPVLKLKGGSGTLSGGYLADFTITAAAAGGGVGLELADCGGVHWNRLRLSGSLAEGIRFHSEASGAFCEYNSGDADIQQSVVLAVRYKKTSGNESFHGSGLTQGTVINVAGTGPAVQIDSGCFPYAAPMTAAFFTHAANTNLIINNHTSRIASFYGAIDVEAQDSGPDTVGAVAGLRILLEGTVGGLAGANLKLGNLYLVDRAYYVGSSTFASYRPIARTTPLAAGTTTIFPDQIGSCMVQVDILAANYHYSYLLHCWQSPYDPTGVVSVLANPKSLNSAGYGAPTFGWSNYGLTVTNAAYTSAVSAILTATQTTQGAGSGDVLGQG